MNTFSFDLWMVAKQRQQDRLQEAEHERLVKEALKARQPQDHNASAVLAQLGRKLTSLGSSLEARYGGQTQAEVRLNR
jgi:hypothetical protein